MTVTPATGQTGNATITVTVNDGPNNTSTDFVVTVGQGHTNANSGSYAWPGGGIWIQRGERDGGERCVGQWEQRNDQWGDVDASGKYGNALSFNGSKCLGQR